MADLSRARARTQTQQTSQGGADSTLLSARQLMGNQAMVALLGLQELQRIAAEAAPESVGGQAEATTAPEKVGGQPEGDVVANPNTESHHVTGASYTEIKGKPFVQGANDTAPIMANDVSQGKLGDCYFVAALAAIAHTQPDVIKRLITDEGDGTYTVHLAEGGDVRVDSKFATKDGAVQFAEEGDKSTTDGPELWVMLIEKAWAAKKGGYENIRGSKVHMKSDDAMEALSGAQTQVRRPSSMQPGDIIKALAEAKSKKWPATLGVRNVTDVEEIKACKATGLVPNHAFAVLDVDEKAGTVTAYNPWGAEYKVPPLTGDTIKKWVDTMQINQVKS